jgi:glycosyl transferase family 25
MLAYAYDSPSTWEDSPASSSQPRERQVPIFVINLDRSPERLAFMQVQAKRHGFAFQRMRGVDGTQDLPRWMAGRFLSRSGAILSNLSPGEVGCYASHLLIYSEMVRRGIAAAIVLEDDVSLEADFVAAAHAAIAHAPPGWDCIHLSTRFKNPCFPVSGLGGGRQLVRYSRLPVGSAAYAVSLSGAAKLLMPTHVRTRPIDMEFRYAWLVDLDMLGIHPAPAIQESHMPSTVAAPWRREGGSAGLLRRRRMPKPRWAPGLLSQLWGSAFVKRKLGLKGTMACWRQDVARLWS